MSLNIKNADGSLTKVAGKTVMTPVNNITTSESLQDAPVGHILSYMGNTAPAHYLICDGAEYNIADYLDLANHFKKEFGSINYFGGDGTSTFKVPDLRGEFLRGTGTNGHAEQGDGAEVGEHQDATKHLRFVIGGSRELWINSNENKLAEDIDKKLSLTTSRSSISSTKSTATSQETYYTARPTNTSVLYCIKYEPTYFMEVTGSNNDYSAEEQIIGKWIDGKPIYRKVYSLTKEYSLKSNTWTVIDDIDFTDKVPFDIKAIYTKNDSNGSTPNLAFYSFNKQLNIMNCRNVAQPLGLNHKIIIEYIKTTD